MTPHAYCPDTVNGPCLVCDRPSDDHANGPRYHGQQDPNAVLRGETPVQVGGTFIADSIDNHGCGAYILNWNQTLSVIHSGTRTKCAEAAATHSGVHVVSQAEHLRRRGKDCPCSTCNPDRP